MAAPWLRGASARRRKMVERQIAARGIADQRVLAAMREVPRHEFVPEAMQEFAYDDSALQIEGGQTISQPYIVALMIEAARLGPGDRVLEIGLGSGYAAAVASRIAAQVLGIERHEALASAARERLTGLGYDNIVVHTGDGTRGWPEEAPFDAILVSAGGPQVPPPLREQLAVGGRLVIPTGDEETQQLVRITRRGEDDFVEETLGAVRFVPLVGAHGWAPEERVPADPPALIRAAAEPLGEIDDPDFAQAFDRFADARIVMLGEASHGTSEFYRARAAITRRLIERHGFTIVAVEADWPDAAIIDRQVRHRPPPKGPSEPPFQRFPTWMWRNAEARELFRWMREHNAALPPEQRASFSGLDLYNLNGSIRAVLGYLDQVDPEAAGIARQRYGCLTPWSSDPAAYGRLAINEGYARCEEGVIAQLRDLFARSREYAALGGDDFLDAAQNARLIANAETYYRVMYYGSAESWNLRDSHMAETLEVLLDARGPQSKAVVWAHNSHIGDARETDMGRGRGEHNLGQLMRESHGSDACLIGLGTHAGTVAAASDWDGEMELKAINPSRPDSYERLCHDAGVERFLLDLREGQHEAVRTALREPRLERYIGVIYRPETERWSHYSESVLPRQYDAWVWFDRTTAVTALPGPQEPGDDLYPFGL
jgi:protein-L-isoaspartate(D-aspartate) O-methyltransferase